MPSTVPPSPATPRRGRGRPSHQTPHRIKHEPGAQQGHSPNDTQETNGFSDGHSATSIPTRLGRSDAPTPSERNGDPGPLLREMRLPGNPGPQSPGIEDSFFHTSFTDIGKKLKACNDTLGELQQLGVSHDVQLPELVLVGDQSAGKSSLMSGLANLDLPRSEGTCTRCPLHIRVSRNADWSCRVWLRQMYQYRPPAHDIDERDVTDDDPFYPWKKMAVTRVHEFKSMHDKSEIEEVLRWAQVAILSDDRPHELFIPGSGNIAVNKSIEEAAAESIAKFSPNVVALEIRGPGLPDLSFYDMPGIFQNTAHERDNYLVNVVRNLSNEYILHPSAIIICAMPTNSDAENSSTFSLVRRLGATNRTIGVLTKADLMAHGNYGSWLGIMKGEKHQTGLGYFITSRPQNKNLDELKRHEEEFFENRLVCEWPEGFQHFKEQCGVENLKAFLSERLGEAFAKSLPNIKHKVKWHLNHIHQELASLPELPENVELEVQTALLTFADKARLSMGNFASRFTVLPNNFRECLLGMKPKIGLKDDSDLPVIEILSDNESEASVATGNSRRRSNVPHTPSKRQRVANDVAAPNSGRSGHIKREDSAPPPQRMPPTIRRKPFPAPFEEFSRVGSGFRTLRQLRAEIESKSKAGMPHLTPVEAYNDLAVEAVRPWKGPTEIFLKETMRQLQVELVSTLDKSLESLKKRFIYTQTKAHLEAFLEDHQKLTGQALGLLYYRETGQMCTFNEEAHKRYELEETAELEHYRHHLRMEARYGKGNTYQPLEDLTEERRAQDAKSRKDDLAKLGEDMFRREIEVAGYVRGYYRLAALRFADAVSQVIICDLIPTVRRQLHSFLEVKLGLRGVGVTTDARTVYERLMAEDAATAAKRETLKSECKKFEKALASIRGLEAGDGADESVHMEECGSDHTMVDPLPEDGEA